MADVELFDLDGTVLNVADASARSAAQAASAQSAANAQDIADLKALSRLTVAYDANTKTIEFTTTTH